MTVATIIFYIVLASYLVGIGIYYLVKRIKLRIQVKHKVVELEEEYKESNNINNEN